MPRGKVKKVMDGDTIRLDLVISARICKAFVEVMSPEEFDED